MSDTTTPSRQALEAELAEAILRAEDARRRLEEATVAEAVGESWDNAIAVGHAEWRPEDYIGYPPEPMVGEDIGGPTWEDWADCHPFSDLIRFQRELANWAERSFGETIQGDGTQANQNFIGTVEELGELVEAMVPVGRLAHHLLKDDQAITGSHEEHVAKAKDAIGDIVVFLAHLCIRRGWNFAEIMRDVWGTVMQRDYAAYPETGGRPPKAEPGLTDEDIERLRAERVRGYDEQAMRDAGRGDEV